MLQFTGLQGIRHDLVTEQVQQFAFESTIFLANLVIGALDLFSIVHGPEVTPMLAHIKVQEWALFQGPLAGPSVQGSSHQIPCPCCWCDELASPLGREQTERNTWVTVSGVTGSAAALRVLHTRPPSISQLRRTGPSAGTSHSPDAQLLWPAKSAPVICQSSGPRG